MAPAATLLRRTVALLGTAAALGCPKNVQAQAPVTRTTTVTTTVGGVFAVSPAQPALVQNSQSGALCSPGACYVGTVVASGNRGWQLQVRLATVPSAFTVTYVATTVPAGIQAVNSGVATPLGTSTWLTIARSTTPTSGSAVGLQFNARRTSGKDGIVPTGAQLAAVVAFQVVAWP